MTKIIAVVKIWNGTEYENVEKEFDVEIRKNGNIYSQEMIDWITKEKRRVTDLFIVKCESKEYLYAV